VMVPYPIAGFPTLIANALTKRVRIESFAYCTGQRPGRRRDRYLGSAMDHHSIAIGVFCLYEIEMIMITERMMAEAIQRLGNPLISMKTLYKQAGGTSPHPIPAMSRQAPSAPLVDSALSCIQ
jgi:hypothetical protein